MQIRRASFQDLKYYEERSSDENDITNEELPSNLARVELMREYSRPYITSPSTSALHEVESISNTAQISRSETINVRPEKVDEQTMPPDIHDNNHAENDNPNRLQPCTSRVQPQRVHKLTNKHLPVTENVTNKSTNLSSESTNSIPICDSEMSDEIAPQHLFERLKRPKLKRLDHLDDDIHHVNVLTNDSLPSTRTNLNIETESVVERSQTPSVSLDHDQLVSHINKSYNHNHNRISSRAQSTDRSNLNKSYNHNYLSIDDNDKLITKASDTRRVDNESSELNVDDNSGSSIQGDDSNNSADIKGRMVKSHDTNRTDPVVINSAREEISVISEPTDAITFPNSPFPDKQLTITSSTPRVVPTIPIEPSYDNTQLTIISPILKNVSKQTQ